MPISADRTNIDLRTRQESNRTVEVNGETAFNAAEDNAVDSFAGIEGFLQILPDFFTACFFAGQNNLSVFVFVTVNINFNFVAGFEFGVLAEFAQRDAAFGFEPDINDGKIGSYADNRTFNHGTGDAVVAELFVQQGFKVFVGFGNLEFCIYHKLSYFKKMPDFQEETDLCGVEYSDRRSAPCRLKLGSLYS